MKDLCGQFHPRIWTYIYPFQLKLTFYYQIDTDYCTLYLKDKNKEINLKTEWWWAFLYPHILT